MIGDVTDRFVKVAENSKNNNIDENFGNKGESKYYSAETFASEIKNSNSNKTANKNGKTAMNNELDEKAAKINKINKNNPIINNTHEINDESSINIDRNIAIVSRKDCEHQD